MSESRAIQSDEVREGNTNSSRVKQANQRVNWFFTWNNFPDRAIEMLKTKFDEICKSYVFQHELGENGTHHLQGCITLKKRGRWSEFDLPKEIHWEKTMNNINAEKYCCKEETRVAGPWSKGVLIRKKLKLITPDRPFQYFILDIIKKEPEERSIYWFYEENGNVGKSSFCKYLVSEHNALFIDEGKKADLMNHVLTFYNSGKEIELVVLDVPRANRNKISYKSIESIKTGMIYSSKYEGGQLLFNTPHVIIFANYLPQWEKLSSDRWKVFKINEDYTITKYDHNEHLIDVEFD